MMEAAMRDHPCFTCSLPDCDDRSKACRLRQLASAHKRALKTRQPSTPEAQAAATELSREHWADYADRQAARGQAALARESQHA
jgi:hypothetical protein